jgi:hypothetical protein
MMAPSQRRGAHAGSTRGLMNPAMVAMGVPTVKHSTMAIFAS